MRTSSYHYHATRNLKISNFNLIKNLLINIGIVSAAISLIVFGITLIAENKESTIFKALPVCVSFTIACFLSIVPINNKLRELRTKKRYKLKSAFA